MRPTVKIQEKATRWIRHVRLATDRWVRGRAAECLCVLARAGLGYRGLQAAQHLRARVRAGGGGGGARGGEEAREEAAQAAQAAEGADVAVQRVIAGGPPTHPHGGNNLVSAASAATTGQRATGGMPINQMQACAAHASAATPLLQ